MIGRAGEVLLIGTSDSIALAPLTMVMSYLVVVMVAVLIAYSAYSALRAFRRRGLRTWHLLAVAVPTVIDAVILFFFWTAQRPQRTSRSHAGAMRPMLDPFINNVAHVTLQVGLAAGVFALIGVIVAVVQQRLESLWSPRWPTSQPMTR